MKLFNKDSISNDISEFIVKSSSFFLLRIISSLIGYVFTIYISNKYDSGIYGLIALGLSMFLILSVFGRLGLDTNIVKFFSQDKNDSEAGIFYKSLLISFFTSSIIVFILHIFSSEIVNNVYKNPKPELLYYLPWILAAVPFWNVGMLCANLLRAKKKNILFAFISNISRFLFSIIFIVSITYYFGDDTKYIVIGHFVATVVTAIFAFIIAQKTLKAVKLKSHVRTSVFLKDAFPMLLSSSMLILLGLVDTQVMGIYETNSNIGIYNVCLKIAAITTFSLQAVNSILAPKIAKSYSEGDMEYKKLIAFSTKLNFLISTIIVVGIILFRTFLLGIFGDSFIAGEVILLIFCFGQIINSFAGSVGVILQMTGKQKVYQNFVVIALILNLILTFILTPAYGGVGAASATVLSMAFWNVGSAIYLKRKMNITSYFNLLNIKLYK